jgi:hypothetical protein
VTRISKRELDLWIAELTVASLSLYFEGVRDFTLLNEWKGWLRWAKYTGKTQ